MQRRLCIRLLFPPCHRGIDTKRPTLVLFLVPTKPHPSYGWASAHTRDSVRLLDEMTGRSQTLPWWLGRGSGKDDRKQYYWFKSTKSIDLPLQNTLKEIFLESTLQESWSMLKFVEIPRRYVIVCFLSLILNLPPFEICCLWPPHQLLKRLAESILTSSLS